MCSTSAGRSLKDSPATRSEHRLKQEDRMKRILIVMILLVAAAAFISCGAKAGDEAMNTENKDKQKNNKEG